MEFDQGRIQCPVTISRSVDPWEKKRQESANLRQGHGPSSSVGYVQAYMA